MWPLMSFTRANHTPPRFVFARLIHCDEGERLTLDFKYAPLRLNFPPGTIPRRLNGTPLFHESVWEREQLRNSPDAKLRGTSGEDRYRPLAEPLPEPKDRQYVE